MRSTRPWPPWRARSVASWVSRVCATWRRAASEHHPYGHLRRRRSAGRPARRRSRSTNPARPGEVVAEVSLADAVDLRRAAESAKKAQPGWAAVPAPVRGRAIAHIGRLIEDNAEALARLVTAEIGKPYAEALGEVREIVDTCDFFLGEGRRLYGQTVPSEMPDKQLFTFRKPVGAVGDDHRRQLPGRRAVLVHRARAAGRQHGGLEAGRVRRGASAAAFHDLFVRGGGLPDGVLNIVHADGAATFAGLDAALEAGFDRQGRLHRLLGRRARRSAR